MQQSQSDHIRDHQPMLGPQQQQLLNQRRRPSLLQSAAAYGPDYGFNSPAHFQYLNSLQERYVSFSCSLDLIKLLHSINSNSFYTNKNRFRDNPYLPSRSKAGLQAPLNINPLSVPSAITANGALGLVATHQGLPLTNAGHPNLMSAAAAAAAANAAASGSGNSKSHSSHQLGLVPTSSAAAVASFQGASHQFGLPDGDFSVNKRPRLFVDNKYQPLLIETNNMVEIKKVRLTLLTRRLSLPNTRIEVV
jgi:hypothetical protein